jgi:His-Xaa-Ser system radical SAM maturase HxsC
MCPCSDKQRQVGSVAQVAEIKYGLEQLPSDIPNIIITGGEPFLMRESIFEVLDTIKRNFEYTDVLLLTNARALASKAFCQSFIASFPEQATIGIPLHGHTAALHDFITQAPGSFEQTVTGLKRLSANRIKIELRIVVSKLNAEHIGDLAAFICTEIPHIDSVKIMGLEMLGSAAKNEADVWIPYDRAFQVSKSAVDMLIAHEIDVGLYNFPLCAVQPNYRSLCERSISDYKIRYVEKCDSCIVKDACGGVFAGTLRLAQKSLCPIG